MTPLTSAQKQQRRNADLDAIAAAAGWQTWQRYSTAVKRGVVSIAPNPAAPQRRGRQKDRIE